jgi:hypothetical protein
MGATSGWVAALWWAGVAVCAVGVLVVLLALFRDRSRGRRRCPRCWYDMSGVPGLACPECGRTAKGVQSLFRTRRRWRRGAVGLVVATFGVVISLAPGIWNEGSLSLVPTPVLIRFAPSAWNDQVWDAGTQLWVLNPVAKEIQRRLKGGETFTEGQWKTLLETAKVVRTRPRWCEGDIYAQFKLPGWLGVQRMYIRAGRDGDAYSAVYPVVGPSDTNYLGGVWAGKVGRGATSAEFELELESVFKGKILIPIGVAADPDEVLLPVRTKEVDKLVQDSMSALVMEHPYRSRRHTGLTLFLNLDAGALAAMADLGVSVRVELLHDGMVLETHAARLLPMHPWNSFNLGGGGSRYWSEVPLEKLPREVAGDPAAQKQWRIRLAGVQDGLLAWMDIKRYWAGQLEMPMQDLVSRESAKGALVTQEP